MDSAILLPKGTPTAFCVWLCRSSCAVCHKGRNEPCVCLSTQHVDHPSLNCGQMWVSFLHVGKHRAWGGFLQRVSLVCVQGVSAKRAGDRSSPPIGRVSVRRGGSRALQSFCWGWEHGSFLPVAKSDPRGQWLFSVRFWLKKILQINSLAQGSSTKGLAGRLSAARGLHLLPETFT